MTDKVDTWIWIWDNELQRKKSMKVVDIIGIVVHHNEYHIWQQEL